MEINHCLFTLLRDNGTKAVQYCCVTKETQQCCTSALLSNRVPTSRCYGNHNTQQYILGSLYFEINLFHACSYLGLGLMAARKEILSVRNIQGATILRSECINPIIKTEWTYAGVTYTVM
jgi:hypothetical protein